MSSRFPKIIKGQTFWQVDPPTLTFASTRSESPEGPKWTSAKSTQTLGESQPRKLKAPPGDSRPGHVENSKLNREQNADLRDATILCLDHGADGGQS